MNANKNQNELQGQAIKEERLAKLFKECMELMNASYRQKHALTSCKINQ